MIRCFVGVRFPIPHSITQVIGELGAMGRALKPVTEENFHVTLSFLGDTQKSLIPRIVNAIRESSVESSPFEIQIVGLGAFPTIARPSVVWAGLQGADELVEIKTQLDEQLEPLGFEREQRKYTPHLTLARVRSRPAGELRNLLEENREFEYGTVSVTEIDLFQSELTSKGPIYRVLESVEL